MWLLLIYKDDASLLIGKGWEFNMAKPIEKIIMIFVAIISIVSMVLPLIYE